MPEVKAFDRVKVIHQILPGNVLYIVTGVAIIDFTSDVPGTDGWTRAPLGFYVPDESGNPLVPDFPDNPFNNPTAIDASCIVYPTAFASANSQDFGWAVDSVSVITGAGPNHSQVFIVANLAARTNTNTILFRVGFQAQIFTSLLPL